MEMSILRFADEACANEIMSINETAGRYGMTLTQKDAREIIAARNEALGDTGRVEFSANVATALAMGLCDSPYVQREDYARAICDMQSLFYHFKSDWGEAIPDETLIKAMIARFNGPCEGSMELLADWKPGKEQA